MTLTDADEPGRQSQVHDLHELELDSQVVPSISNGEVEELSLKSLDEVRAALANGEFKDNYGMTWLAFLISHGHLTTENEPDFVEINARLHRKHDLFIV